MKMGEMSRYILTDAKRLLGSPRIYLAIAGVTASLLFSLEKSGLADSVLGAYMRATNRAGFLLVFLFAALPFSTVFCEDIEHQYIYYSVVRGKMISYVMAKCIMIFISSLTVMIAGTVLFLAIYRIYAPWGVVDGTFYGVAMAGNYSFLLTKQHYVSYCLICAFQFGLIAGVLSLASALASNYIRNQVLLMILPVLFYQLLHLLPDGLFSIYTFWPYAHSISNDRLYFWFVLGMSMAVSMMLVAGIYMAVKKK